MEWICKCNCKSESRFEFFEGAKAKIIFCVKDFLIRTLILRGFGIFLCSHEVNMMFRNQVATFITRILNDVEIPVRIIPQS